MHSTEKSTKISKIRNHYSTPEIAPRYFRPPKKAFYDSFKLSWSVLLTFEKSSKIDVFGHFSVSLKNLSSIRKFAQGIKSTQRMHFWITYNLRKGRKLLPSETNSQILRYLHFCGPTARFFSLPN